MMEHEEPHTPPSSPRELVCPGAPKKKRILCEGCRMLYSGKGGENQEAHMGVNGCLAD